MPTQNTISVTNPEQLSACPNPSLAHEKAWSDWAKGNQRATNENVIDTS